MTDASLIVRKGTFVLIAAAALMSAPASAQSVSTPSTSQCHGRGR